MTINLQNIFGQQQKQNPLQMFQQPKDMSVEPTMTSISEDFLMDLKKTNDSLKNQIKTSSAPTTGSGATAFNWFSLPQAEAKTDETIQQNIPSGQISHSTTPTIDFNQKPYNAEEEFAKSFQERASEVGISQQAEKYGMSPEEFKNLPAAPYQVDDNIDSPTFMPNPISASKAIMWIMDQTGMDEKTAKRAFAGLITAQQEKNKKMQERREALSSSDTDLWDKIWLRIDNLIDYLGRGAESVSAGKGAESVKYAGAGLLELPKAGTDVFDSAWDALFSWIWDITWSLIPESTKENVSKAAVDTISEWLKRYTEIMNNPKTALDATLRDVISVAQEKSQHPAEFVSNFSQNIDLLKKEDPAMYDVLAGIIAVPELVADIALPELVAEVSGAKAVWKNITKNILNPIYKRASWNVKWASSASTAQTKTFIDWLRPERVQQIKENPYATEYIQDLFKDINAGKGIDIDVYQDTLVWNAKDVAVAEMEKEIKGLKNKWARLYGKIAKSGQSVSSDDFVRSLNKWLSWQWEAYEMFWESVSPRKWGVSIDTLETKDGSIKYVANIDKGIEWSVANRESGKLTDFINRFNSSIKDWTLSAEDIIAQRRLLDGKDYANFSGAPNTITENNKFWRAVRASWDGVAKQKVKWLLETDKIIQDKINDLSDLKRYFFYTQGQSEWQIRTNIASILQKINSTAQQGKKEALDRLLPWFSDKMAAIWDLKDVYVAATVPVLWQQLGNPLAAAMLWLLTGGITSGGLEWAAGWFMTSLWINTALNAIRKNRLKNMFLNKTPLAKEKIQKIEELISKKLTDEAKTEKDISKIISTIERETKISLEKEEVKSFVKGFVKEFDEAQKKLNEIRKLEAPKEIKWEWFISTEWTKTSKIDAIRRLREEEKYKTEWLIEKPWVKYPTTKVQETTPTETAEETIVETPKSKKTTSKKLPAKEKKTKETKKTKKDKEEVKPIKIPKQNKYSGIKTEQLQMALDRMNEDVAKWKIPKKAALKTIKEMEEEILRRSSM